MGHRASTDAGVLYAIVHADGPVTRSELAGRMDGTSADAVSRSLINLWRDGYVLRRKREKEGRGRNPYEHTIAPAEDDGEPYTGRVECSGCGRESEMFRPNAECSNSWCEGVFEPA